MHILAIRLDDVFFEWDPPGTSPSGSAVGAPPAEQSYVVRAGCQAIFMPPETRPSAWIELDHLVDDAVAGSGWNIQPTRLQCRFVCVLDMQRSLFRPR